MSDSRKIIALLKKHYPREKFPMDYDTPMQLLSAVIMSAQCTDERVNKVARELFRKYRTPRDFANADIRTFEQEIRSTGFFRNKAKNIIAAASMIESEHKGRMPKTMDALLSLPGVARKTANVVLQELYGMPSGIVVDTHVLRVAKRLGLSDKSDARRMEGDLLSIVEKRDWIAISSQIKAHGQRICRPRPLCSDCFLNRICPSAFLF